MNPESKRYENKQIIPGLTPIETFFLFLLVQNNPSKQFTFNHTNIPKNKNSGQEFDNLKKVEMLRSLQREGYIMQGGERKENQLTLTDKAIEAFKDINLA